MPLPIIYPALALADEPDLAGRLAELLPVIAAALGGLALVGVVLLVLVTRRIARLGASLDKRHEVLSSIEANLGALTEGSRDASMQRITHLLIEIRDGQKRVAERLAQNSEAMVSAREAAAAHEATDLATEPGANRGIGVYRDRILSRLVALGFEQIEIVTLAEELPRVFKDGGEVIVEARRGGAHYKGRVLVDNDSIAEVALRSAYEMFP